MSIFETHSVLSSVLSIRGFFVFLGFFFLTSTFDDVAVYVNAACDAPSITKCADSFTQCVKVSSTCFCVLCFFLFAKKKTRLDFLKKKKTKKKPKKNQKKKRMLVPTLASSATAMLRTTSA